jgi:dipeptidyl aminopeptidase/acylaminoacyl peptidase
MVFCNGLDSIKEMIVLAIRESFADRGISVLAIDHPGVGEALRLRGMTAIPDTERWAGAAVDYLEGRADVDPERIGMMGWSLGGYYAPRAACYEKRFKLCVAWGANHNWGELQRRRLAREGDRPVPHYWDHVMWVWGQPDMEHFMAYVPSITLDGQIEKLRMPFLITHGGGDRQIPVTDAQRSYDQAVNSPKRHQRIFTPADFEIEHCGADNGTVMRDYIADWCAETFAELG